MKTLQTYPLIALILITAHNLSAQDRWSAELRPAVNFATQDFGNAELKTGYGFEAALGYRFMPHLGAYVGWGWHRFKSDGASFAGTEDTDFEETGYTFGLQFIHPFNVNSKLSYLLRAGAIYNHIEVENDAGDITADSGHGLGWELGAGIRADLGSGWNVRPQVGYRALSRDIEIGTTTTDVKLNYIALGVGIVKTF
jgi:hypothetical protein